MSRLLTLLGYEQSHLRRNRARQWKQAALRQAQCKLVFKVLDFNLAAGQLAAGW